MTGAVADRLIHEGDKNRDSSPTATAPFSSMASTRLAASMNDRNGSCATNAPPEFVSAFVAHSQMRKFVDPAYGMDSDKVVR